MGRIHFFIASNIVMTVLAVTAVSHQSHAAQERSVSVQGTCLRSAQPNRASITFYAESLNKDAQVALKDAVKNFQAARAEIQKLQLKNLELETVENTVYEEKVWENNKHVFKGYKARVGLKVVTQDISKIGEVIAVVAKKGISNIGQLVTDMSPAKMKAEQEACLEQAIANAKSKANRMAKAAGTKVGKVISIVESYEQRGFEPRPIAYADSSRSAMVSSMAAPESAIPSIDVRAQDISMSVSVMFALE